MLVVQETFLRAFLRGISPCSLLVILIYKYFDYTHSADKASEVDVQKMWPKSGSCDMAEAEFESGP